MTDVQQAMVDMALLMFEEKHPDYPFTPEEKACIKRARNVPNVPYMHLYSNVYSSPATPQSYRIRSHQGSRVK